ncbi:MAG: phosphoadenosine phosphosulfate reductase family protein [Verrucomicrobiota bacterium]|nr:phosphoadenosine phosphosulfate reductase family protein [Limisphaera sp.]MDW8380596.1 phosphoadenosine phosphosulfate reductase family protein [Verrucomicrobiota bacterium]
MNRELLQQWNDALQARHPRDTIRWAVQQSEGRVVVSTNFRPYEAVLLHMCVCEYPDMPVLWVDHGYNRPATYRHAEALRTLLKLNLKIYHPRISAAHRDAVYGPLPGPDDEEGLRQFSLLMKLEPFQRAMRDLAPKIWLTALRRVQNPHRANLEMVVWDETFHVLKVSPLLHWTDSQMESYLQEHGLPNEWDYHDPAKADEKRECGLHAGWKSQKLGA